jgi:endonuclease/exonuclease/phosphatase family metal-dependent hydrolase
MRREHFRFINTHLESNDATVNELQAKELLAGPADTDLPVVLVGDFNAEASGAGSPTYGDLTAGGFKDAWTQTHPIAPGFTWGRDNLANPTTPFSERIDLVLFHGKVNAVTSTLIGTDPADRTPSGLWPSDHLAVDVTLKLQWPRGGPFAPKRGRRRRRWPRPGYGARRSSAQPPVSSRR